MKKLGLIFSCILLLSSVCYADSIRQRTMGNTSVATRSEARSFQNNPAKLGFVKSDDINMLRGFGGASSDILARYNDLLKIKDSNTQSEQIEKLKALVPMDVSGSFSVAPWVSKTNENIGFTLFTQGQFSGALNRKTSPKFTLSGDVNTTLMVGFSQTREFMGQDVIFGVAPKFSHHLVFYNKANGNESMVFNQSSILKGINKLDGAPKFSQYSLMGLGIDLGFLIPYESNNGAWGASIKNAISSVSGTKSIDNQADQKINRREPLKVTVGSETELNAPLVGDVIVAADYDLYTQTDTRGFKRIHLGVEKSLFDDKLKLRGGINEGFIVGGFGYQLGILLIEYGIFVEEAGFNLGNNTSKMQLVTFGLRF